MGKLTEQLNDNLKQNQPGYERALLQTYFTAPEWRNVEMSEELGKFLHKGNAFYRFPFFKQIATFWSVFHHSYQAAKRHHSHRTLWLSEYMVMNLFIGISTTMGFGALGIFSLLLYPWMPLRNNTTFQRHVAEIVSDYATFIHTIPFYNYPYLKKWTPLWQQFKHSPDRTWADYATLLTAGAEIFARALLSAPVAWWYNQPQNQAADKIHLLVKTHDIRSLSSIDPAMTILDHSKEYTYAHITVPRYEAFSKAVNQLIKNDVKIQKIAGQNKIQFKISAKDETSTKGQYHLLYAYQNHLDKKSFMMIDVPTQELAPTIDSLEKNNVKIKYMHDF